MQRLPSLPRLALAVWLAWLGLIGLMFVMQARQVWHPRFVPMTGLLVLLVVAGSSLIVGASWRLLRGPRRGRALAWILLGTAPLWFMAGHAMYGFDAAYGHNVRLDLPLKMLVPLGGSLMDLESRIRYPRRTDGEKVVMISTPAANAREQVTAMDQHIRQLETRLGRRSAWRTRWVRGPLMGLEGRAIFNLCMGSRPGDGEGDAGSLTPLDRHEVAHCVITSLNAPGSEPPAVLVEGWAEANQGTDPTEQAFRAWDRRRYGDDLSLRELIGPDWYWCHLPPAYIQGAPLVNYLLRRFGPERFLSLYTTCHPATFADDCQRILGVSLAKLDADFWMDIDQIVAQDGSPSRWRLARLKLGPKVDPVAWKMFLKEYFAATDRLLAPYEHAWMTAEYTFMSTDDHGKAQKFPQQIRSIRSGLSRSLWIKTGDGQQAYLAHPGRSLVAHRKAPNDPWEVEEDPQRDPERSYRRIGATIDEESLGSTAAALLSQTEHLRNRADPESIVVAAFERFAKEGRPLVQVRLEDQSKYDSVPWRALTFVLSSDLMFAAQSYEYEKPGRERTPMRGEIAYDMHDGIPVLRAVHSTGKSPAGESTAASLTIVERRFDPVPDQEFTAERLLNGPTVRKVVDRYLSFAESTAFAKWYWYLLVAGAASLVAGVVISLLWGGVIQRNSPRPAGLIPVWGVDPSPSSADDVGQRPGDPTPPRGYSS